MSFFGPMDGTRHWTLGTGGVAAAVGVGRRKPWWGRIPRRHAWVRVLLAWIGV